MNAEATSWWGFAMGVLTGFALAVGSPCHAHAQELITYQQIIAAQERWQAAITTPSPWDSAKPEKAAHEAPRPRQTAIQKIIEESSRCVVDWHSQRPSRPSRITCYAAR